MHQSKQTAKTKPQFQQQSDVKTQEATANPPIPLAQQISRMGNVPNPSAHAAILNRFPSDRSSSNPQFLLQLQRQYGNRYVNQVLQQAQRTPIQTKLTLGAVGDKYEQEAELMMKPIVQRQSSEADENIAPELETSIQQEKGSGQPLAENIRKPMEQAFGTDFSTVKVHTNTQSDRLNQSIQAQAFTTGQDIFFRQGTYNPGSQGGQELIAHELTHVVQQGDKQIAGTATGIQPSAASESGEVIQCVKLPSTKKFRRWLGRHTILPPMGEAGREGRKERKRVRNGQIIPLANVNNNKPNGYSFAELWNMEEGAWVLKSLDPSHYAAIKKSKTINEGDTDKWKTNESPYVMQFSPILTCGVVIFIYGSLDNPTKIAVYHATGSTIYESEIKQDADFIIMISASLAENKAKNDETDLRKPFQKLGINNKLRVLKGVTFYAVTSDGRVGNGLT